MNNYQMNVEVELSVRTCPTCFVIYGIPQEMLNRKNKEGGSWYCLNGHSLSFTESELQKTQKLLKKAEEDKQYWMKRKSEADTENLNLNRKILAKKGEMTKLKNRIAKGVCPCCNRSFVNLHRHMTSQHPDFKEKE